MASNSNNHNNSPKHLGLTGQFWPVFDDIHQLLGEAGSEQHAGIETKGYAHHAGRNRTTTASSQTATVAAALSAAVSQASWAGVTDEDAKVQARSERKRTREKQRRCDVNKQFADLTKLVQKIDDEDINEEAMKNGTTRNRMTFNPANRVELIANTIVLLERLHEAGKRRKSEIGSLQQELEEAKKAGEDTAAKLKEAMLASPGQPLNKQCMTMVPMMMSSGRSGAPSALPMMNTFMQQPGMSLGPMAPQAMAAMPNPPTQAPQDQASGSTTAAPSQHFDAMMMAPQPVAATHLQQQQQQQQHLGQPTPQAPAFQYMMPPMAGGGYMMPFRAPIAGQPMVQQPMHTLGVQQQTTPQESQLQTAHQEQKDSDPGVVADLTWLTVPD